MGSNIINTLYELYFKDGIRMLLSVSGAIVLYMFGEPTQFMYILAYVILLDFITGTLKAVYLKTVNSVISRNGVLKKIGMLLGISAIHMFDLFMGSGDLFRNLLVNMFIVTELISIIENLADMDILIPNYIKIIFKRI